MARGQPDRRHRLLHRADADRGRRQPDVLPFVAEAPLRQAELDDVQELVEDRRRVLDVHAEAVELELLVAGSDAELEPPVGDGVGEAGFRQQAHGMVHRQDADGAPEPDALRQRRHVRHHHQRRRAEAVVREVVLGVPRRVEAGLVGEHGLLHRGVQHIGRGLMVAALLHEDEDAELHGGRFLPADRAKIGLATRRNHTL